MPLLGAAYEAASAAQPMNQAGMSASDAPQQIAAIGARGLIAHWGSKDGALRSDHLFQLFNAQLDLVADQRLVVIAEEGSSHDEALRRDHLFHLFDAQLDLAADQRLVVIARREARDDEPLWRDHIFHLLNVKIDYDRYRALFWIFDSGLHNHSLW